MSNQADIRDIQILGDLKTAFGRFGEDVLQVLAALEKQFEEIQERLEERQLYWGSQVDQARDELHEARHEMHKCHRRAERADDDDYVDCSFEEERVSDAESELAKCEENWEIVKKWRHRIEGQIAGFEGDMHRLSNLASSRTSSVQAFLASKIEILDRYVGGSSSVAAGLHSMGGYDKMTSRSSLAEVGERYFCAKIRNQRLAGKNHEVTGIPFNKYGFPDFSSVAIKTVKIVVKNSRSDRLAANKQSGISKEPRGYIWHHHEDGTTLQLVPKDIHGKTGHSGGAAGQDSLYTFSFPNYD